MYANVISLCGIPETDITLYITISIIYVYIYNFLKTGCDRSMYTMGIKTQNKSELWAGKGKEEAVKHILAHLWFVSPLQSLRLEECNIHSCEKNKGFYDCCLQISKPSI